jgi:MFS family permease
MGKAYLVGPLICTLVCWTYGNGVLPLLPLYAIERGASPSVTGLVLAYGFLCLAVGTTVAGLLPKRFRRRKLLVAASGIAIALLTWLTSRTTTLVPFAAFSGACWLFAGIIFSQTAALVGMAASPKDRGTAFGILGATNGLGSLLGGLGVGYAADRVGFEHLFDGIAVLCLLIVVGALVSVESPPMLPGRTWRRTSRPSGPGHGLSPARACSFFSRPRCFFP